MPARIRLCLKLNTVAFKDIFCHILVLFFAVHLIDEKSKGLISEVICLRDFEEKSRIIKMSKG